MIKINLSKASAERQDPALEGLIKGTRSVLKPILLVLYPFALPIRLLAGLAGRVLPRKPWTSERLRQFRMENEPDLPPIFTREIASVGNIKGEKPESILFVNDFSEVPKDWVSVYHIGSTVFFNMYEKYGLEPLTKTYSLRDLDGSMGRLVLNDPSRGQHVFAYPEVPSKWYGGRGGMLIECRIDPKRARVLDADRVGNRIVKEEFDDPERSMSLEDYLKLNPEDRDRRFVSPEVLLPPGESVTPDFMRVVENIENKEKDQNKNSVSKRSMGIKNNK